MNLTVNPWNVSYPQPLKKGDSVAIVAPSGVVDFEYVQQMKPLLKHWGLNVLLGKHLLEKYGRFAGTIQERISDFQTALDDPDIRAIFCARGGYGAIQLLDKISLENFKKQPKWVVGYSDITAFHSMLSRAEICSLHAPMSSHFAKEGEDESILALKNSLFGKKIVYRIENHPLNRLGNYSGFTRGGNLSVLHALRGTLYDFRVVNAILFIEDANEKPYHIERMMYNLKLGGILSKISGLIVGKFADCEEDPLMNQTIYESISQLVSEYDYPVCFNFPVGHTKENYPLLESGRALFSVNNDGVTLEYI